ncbi:MAG: amidohydrolase family protein [Clostridia bacterium]|nr:amidohydrolase family protein [Clostridia bacterium]
MKIFNAKIYDRSLKIFRDGELNVEDGRIVREPAGGDAVDFGGDYVIPGLIDTHTHGRNGFDFISASVDDLRFLKKKYAEKGVTTVVPALASDTLENMVSAVGRIREAGFRAVHVEGRYMNPKRKGAHLESLLKPLDPSEIPLFREAAGEIHVHVSAAYELDRDGSFLRAVLDNGMSASLAHTDATFDEAMDAVRRGVTSFTHLFNAMPQIHHRAGGAIMAGILSGAYVEMICDGFHLAPETVRLVSRAKPLGEIVLITDSMEGAGCPDGVYSIAGKPVTVKDGKAYTEEGNISGSTLDLFTGLINFTKFSGLSLEKTVECATFNPASLHCLPDVGRIEPGCRADFLRLSTDMKLKEVYVGGVVVK